MGVEGGPSGLGRWAWLRSVSGGLAVALLLGTLSCGTGGPAAPAPGSARGAQPVSLPADCTARVVELTALQRALREAKPGARVCVTGD
ncbi:MAG: hypothetical protein QOG57_5485, partial [Pseudonocardiales bacterium]|nr:hypothetical protein [Pseudonocardiales bacterium]